MLYNLVRVYTTTTGQGDLTLGTAVTGFLTFAEASIPNGTTVSYGIKDGNYSEVGTGVYTSATNNLTRNVLASNDSGAKLYLSGTAEVFITVLAGDIPTTFDNLTDGSTNKAFTSTLKTKLDGIEAGAEVNNISDANATDLTDGGETTLHTHASAIIHYSKSAGVTTTGANTTPVSVSGAVFSYVANAVYRIWVMGRLNSTAATTGAGIQFDLSSAVTAIDVQFFHQLASAGTLTSGHSIADDASVGVSSGVPAGPLDVPITAFGLLVTGANVGTCQLRLRSETTAVTELLAGVVMVVERLA